MAEPNPQPDQVEATPQPVKVKGGGVMGPIVAAIIIVAGMMILWANKNEKKVNSRNN